MDIKKIKSKIYVIGVGMTKFEKPGRRKNFDYSDMAKESITKALADAKIDYKKIEQACCGYVYGDSCSGQRALYEVGMTGIPVINVNNNCATGSTALFVASKIIEAKLAHCVLALGFDKMAAGSLTSVFTDRANPVQRHVETMASVSGFDAAPVMPQLFGNAGKEHMRKFGTTKEHLAKIAYKNHKHSVNNPYSQFQTEYSMADILNSPTVFDPLTKLQCCPTSDGSAAAILVSVDFLKANSHLKCQAVEILGIEMATDFPSSFAGDPMRIVGYDVTRYAANKLYKNTGVTPDQVQVVELHDCFSTNELISYEALGLCEEGKAGQLIDSGNNTYGGKYVINPSGGLISKGHPLGATGLAQCAELCWQLRGLAEKRQVFGAKIALQHNIGLGGAVVVALYKLAFQNESESKVPSMVSEDFRVSRIFDLIQEAFKEQGAELVSKIKGVFCFKVTAGPNGNESYWLIDAKSGNGSVLKTNKEMKSDVTIIMTDNDLYDLLTGAMNPQKAFFQGKLKIKGNMGLAMKMQTFLKEAEAHISKL